MASTCGNRGLFQYMVSLRKVFMSTFYPIKIRWNKFLFPNLTSYWCEGKAAPPLHGNNCKRKDAKASVSLHLHFPRRCKLRILIKDSPLYAIGHQLTRLILHNHVRGDISQLRRVCLNLRVMHIKWIWLERRRYNWNPNVCTVYLFISTATSRTHVMYTKEVYDASVDKLIH